MRIERGHPSDALLRTALKNQYHANLAMLRNALEACPAELWDHAAHRNPFWRVAYHTLFYTDFYLQPRADDFQPWARHQHEVQYMDQHAPAPSEAAGAAPGAPFTPYSRQDLLEYWKVCDALVDDAVDALDLGSAESGFDWYPISKIEHQFVNLRHLAHHTGQLIDRVRAASDVGVQWFGRRRDLADPTRAEETST